MGDIFVSYAREDHDKAKVLAESLGERGWTVWWDRKIPPGKSFDQVIKEALEGAKCVIVLWSQASVNSDWVKEEATDAAHRGILLPALIEDVEPPLGFRRLQAARLTDWYHGHDDGDFEELARAIGQIIELSPRPIPPRPPQPLPPWSTPTGCAPLVTKKRTSRIVRIAVGGKEHQIKFKYHMWKMSNIYVTTINGVNVCENGSQFTLSQDFYAEFMIPDNANYYGKIEGSLNSLGTKINRFRLIINGRILYDEGWQPRPPHRRSASGSGFAGP